MHEVALHGYKYLIMFIEYILYIESNQKKKKQRRSELCWVLLVGRCVALLVWRLWLRLLLLLLLLFRNAIVSIQHDFEWFGRNQCNLEQNKLDILHYCANHVTIKWMEVRNQHEFATEQQPKSIVTRAHCIYLHLQLHFDGYGIGARICCMHICCCSSFILLLFA